MAVFNFREQQERSRRLTAVLVVLFVVMVVIISAIIGALLALVLGGEEPGGLDVTRLDWGMSTVFGVIFAAVIGAIALFKVVSLGSDGAKVATSLGAVEVDEFTRDPFQRRFVNIVEEMAIAAGLPRPRAFVIPNETGINAFAAGGSPQQAVVAVTQGSLEKLNREELAGVVGHEMAHIGNYDTRLNVRLMGMVFGLVALSVVGRIILRSGAGRRGGRNNKGAGAILIIGLALLVLGSLGVLGGRILQGAVSRRREYLADATGVQFTRDPTGLANALKKIRATAAGSRIENAHAEEARHMFFAGATSALSNLYGTHPPIDSRIRALDPLFDPDTDPIMRKDEQRIIAETRADLVGAEAQPWGPPAQS